MFPHQISYVRGG